MSSTTGLTGNGSSLTARNVSPPPQGLSRGNRALSISKTRAPARETPYATIEPAGPAPTTATSKRSTSQSYNAPPGGVPERPKGTGCKPVGSAYGGSNPPAPIITSQRPARAPLGAGGGLFPAHSAAALRGALRRATHRLRLPRKGQ